MPRLNTLGYFLSYAPNILPTPTDSVGMCVCVCVSVEYNVPLNTIIIGYFRDVGNNDDYCRPAGINRQVRQQQNYSDPEIYGCSNAM